MFTKCIPRILNNVISKCESRSFHLTQKKYEDMENPLSRTWRILKDDFVRLKGPSENDKERERALMGLFPRHADILIIGGGAVGSSIAYWLKEKSSREGLRVVVVEKDKTYSKCSTVLSAGGLHQQYSLPENIQMSIYGAEFLRTIKKRFGPEANAHFTPQGYLVLADEAGAQTLIDNSIIEKELGVVNQLLTKDQLKQRFPWMNVTDVEIGNLGVERQGWFDPWALLTLMRYGATDLGAQYIDAELVDFIFTERQDYIAEGMDDTYEAVHEAVIKMPNGEHRTIEFAYCIIAAGVESLEIAQLARIGVASGMLSVPLPLKTKHRYVYKFDCHENPPGINAPMTVDPSGVYFRRNGLGGSFIGGVTPSDKIYVSNEEFFHQEIYPILENRVPAFKSIKMTNSWSGIYENNYYDDSGILGPHPYYHNLYLATGFSSYGIQHAPAIGRAVAELIIDGNFRTIDLTRFGFDRFIVNKPMYETGVV